MRWLEACYQVQENMEEGKKKKREFYGGPLIKITRGIFAEGNLLGWML